MIRLQKEKEHSFFQAFLAHVRQNPTDKVLVEVHGDGKPLPKNSRYRTQQQLTAARARVLEKLLDEFGLSGKERVMVRGMGSAFPKAPNTSSENRELNNRIEIVVYPPDLTVPNSRRLPALTDRERMTVTVVYSRDAEAVRDLTVVERLPPGWRYVRGSGTAGGKAKEPQIQGNDLIWTLGSPGRHFQESITYGATRDPGTPPSPGPVTRLRFTAGSKTRTRDFDRQSPRKEDSTIPTACGKCHGSMTAGPYTHGPAGAGYCTLCHDPHASDYTSWTRDQSWRLCTTCHAEKRSDVHLIRGVARGISHPTRKRGDPKRPGKQLACISCHSPHSAETPELLTYGAKDMFELCEVCHPKK
jgi:predicted CXXCH cytochrome family protein